ncbi:hypothetical protein DFP73DRAFT_561239 [Morchella snyderi]|nr:hypothetical protein DFP73DRAFT_561239 [Morchella snyderi]
MDGLHLIARAGATRARKPAVSAARALRAAAGDGEYSDEEYPDEDTSDEECRGEDESTDDEKTEDEESEDEEIAGAPITASTAVPERAARCGEKRRATSPPVFTRTPALRQRTIAPVRALATFGEMSGFSSVLGAAAPPPVIAPAPAPPPPAHHTPPHARLAIPEGRGFVTPTAPVILTPPPQGSYMPTRERDEEVQRLLSLLPDEGQRRYQVERYQQEHRVQTQSVSGSLLDQMNRQHAPVIPQLPAEMEWSPAPVQPAQGAGAMEIEYGSLEAEVARPWNGRGAESSITQDEILEAFASTDVRMTSPTLAPLATLVRALPPPALALAPALAPRAASLQDMPVAPRESLFEAVVIPRQGPPPIVPRLFGFPNVGALGPSRLPSAAAAPVASAFAASASPLFKRVDNASALFSRPAAPSTLFPVAAELPAPVAAPKPVFVWNMAAPGPALAVQEPKPLPPKAEFGEVTREELVGQECVPVAVQPAPPAPVSSAVPEQAPATTAAAVPEPAVSRPAEVAAAAPPAPVAQELLPVEVKEEKAKATKVSNPVWEDCLGLPDTPQPRIVDKLPVVVSPPTFLVPSSSRMLSRKEARRAREAEEREVQRRAAEVAARKERAEEYARTGPRYVVPDIEGSDALKMAKMASDERRRRVNAEAKEREARLRAVRPNPPVVSVTTAQISMLAPKSAPSETRWAVRTRIPVSAPSEARWGVKSRMWNPRAIAQTLSAFVVVMGAGLWAFGYGGQQVAQGLDSVGESLHGVMCGPGGDAWFGLAPPTFCANHSSLPVSCSASVAEGAEDGVPREEISSEPCSVLFQDVFGALSCGLAAEEVPMLVVSEPVPEEVCGLYEAGMTYGTGEGIPVCETPAVLAWGFTDYLLGLLLHGVRLV